jgi:ATP/maltotriose-dependent transcriptional regulator MalT
VERGEDDPQRCWLAVTRALASALTPPAPAPAEPDGGAIIEGLLSVLDLIREPVVLVIDDLHQLRSAGALAQLGLLLTRMPLLVHVVLATRHDPTGGSGSERTLRALEDENAFVISLDAGRSWFRYHHLFGDLLRLQLRCHDPELVTRLHRSAARWQAEYGQPAAARDDPARPGDQLSRAELRVLSYLPGNLSGSEIGAELFVSPNTVRTHMRHIYDKLGVHRRSDAVRRARQLGLLAYTAGRAESPWPSGTRYASAGC